MKRKITLSIAAVSAIAVVAAGCGSTAGNSSYSAGAYGSGGMASAASATGAAKVRIANSPLGRIVVDGKGSTLYLFENDKGAASTCYGACASVWPPATVTGKPAAGPGVLAGKLGTTKRKDGQVELTYNGHPLYRYVGDAGPRDTKGEGLHQFGAQWYVLAPTGNKIDRD